MAFIFVPNADGSFTEGDKQTNPDTGVEYIYDSGAWRALGPKIEDEFDTLDERYLKKSGDTVSGALGVENSSFFMQKDKDNKKFKIAPNSGDNFFTNIYSFGNAGMRFRVCPGQQEADYKTFLTCSHDEHTINGTTHPVQSSLSWLKTPTSSHHATNKDYVDKLVKEYVDESILQLLEGGLPDPPAGDPAPPSVVKPAFLAWEYDGESGNVTSPSSGHFYLNASSSSSNSYLRLSFNSQNGVKIGDGKFSDINMDWKQYGTHCSIWEWVTTNNKNAWKLKKNFYVDATRWNYKPSGQSSAHLELKISNGYQIGHDWSSLAVGAIFYITVGGLF